MFSKFQVYISCPMSVPQERIDEYAKVILKLRADVDFWKRGTPYNNEALKRADAIVVLLEENKWRQSIPSIPKGTMSEIRYADEYDIPIFIGYINADKQRLIYATSLDHEVRGVAGSSGEFEKMSKKWNEDEESPKKVSKPGPYQTIDMPATDPVKIDGSGPGGCGQFAPDFMRSLLRSQGNVVITSKAKTFSDVVYDHFIPGVHVMGIDPITPDGIVEMLKGYKDHYGVPASANDEFVRHTKGVIDRNCTTTTGNKTTTTTYDKRLLILLR